MLLLLALTGVAAWLSYMAAGGDAIMVGGGTAFYQMYLTEQRKDPATPIIPSLRKMSGGGAPMPPEIYEEVKQRPNFVVRDTIGL